MDRSTLFRTLTLFTDGRVHVPQDGTNLALRAAQALQKHAGVNRGAVLRLHKRIPTGAGLGGGSSDAAAVLRGLNSLWGLGYSLDDLCEIGLSIGADIPYCLHGGLCRVQGIGEIISPLETDKVFHLVILQPCRALSTRQVFTALGAGAPAQHPDTEGVIRALRGGQYAALAAAMGNTLQAVSASFRPESRQAVTHLKEYGAKAAQMTGSGSAVFGVFATAAAARTAWEALSRRYRVCHLTQTLPNEIRNPQFIVNNSL